ncbi:sulfurtransferase [Mumia sp. ZJ430]|uniref:sulfurtransferase n=1 Tax=Mumia sp. ZJ430 TaxID=2708083 RepID=UPI0014224B5F|nr:sulfurtransferase [Mumia sp. ZJ430]
MPDVPALVDVAWLADRLDSDVRVVDVTTFLTQPEGDGYYDVESGREAYEKGHVPGAVFADLLADFADTDAATTFTALDSDTFAQRLGALGIGNDDHVVLYDQGVNIWATRFWWNLRLEGFDRISILNGGFTAWREAGQPVTSGVETLPATTFVAKRRPELLADVAQVRAAIDDDSRVLVNSLDEATYKGERQTYARPGRIPGSSHVFFGTLLDESGRLRDAEEVRGTFKAAGALDVDKKPITYCGSGIAATTLAFTLAQLGRDDVAVYDGSMTEWAADETLPLEVG